MRSAPTTIAAILPCIIMAPAMLSEITVVGMPSFLSVDVDLLALFDGGPDHAQSRTVTGGGQSTGVTVREHAPAGGHEGSAVASHGLVGGDVFGVHALGFFDECLLDVRERTDAQEFELLLHATDRPEEIDGGGARLADDFADLVELLLEVVDIVSLGMLHSQGNAHRSGYANRWRAPHDHVTDGIRHLLVGGAGEVCFFGGQLPLIDEAHAGVGPFERLDHRTVLRSRFSVRASSQCWRNLKVESPEKNLKREI